MGTKTQKLSNVVDQIVEWQSVFTGDGSTGLTAVAGRGYFIDTTSGTVTVTLPASPKIGDTITIADYATTFATNNVTINPNGNKIEANTANGLLSTNDQTHTLVYTDSTQGWKIINQDTASTIQPSFVSATGGTVTTSGDYKIHTFTGDGCFVVSSVGNPTGGPSVVDYLVVAGGGSGGTRWGGNENGGGGAGGFRYSASSFADGCAPASPLSNPTGLTITATTYPVTVGAGGNSPGTSGSGICGTAGSNSVFSTITSAGGGGGGSGNSLKPGLPGGSGGGAGGGAPGGNTGGVGNTPPTSPPQGQPGGDAQTAPDYGAAGGGGAIAAALGNPPTRNAGNGAGLPNAFGTSGQNCGSYYYFSGGGGGGGGHPLDPSGFGTGGLGGGGNGGTNTSGVTGTANTGGGGGGGGASPSNSSAVGGAGGKGIVVIRYKFQ